MSSARISEMRELVVPLDGREGSVRSVPVAGRLADRLGLGLRLFAASDDEGEIADWMHDVAERHLPDRDVTIDVAPSGDVVEAIVSAAGETGLVCMATAASLRPHQGHVGSVAEGVVRMIGRPAALVGPHMEPHPGEHTQRIVVPVDGSDFSEASLDVAADLAQALGVPLWVVTVISPKTLASASVQLGGMPTAGDSGYVAGLARDLGRRYEIDVEYEVLHMEDAARAVVDFAGDDGTVLMATHGRSGLNRVFGGSVATGVVAHSHRAVFVWRPEVSSQ